MNKMRLIKFFLLILNLGIGYSYGQDNIFKVTPCSSPIIYSVDDIMLKENVGKELTAGDINPVYSGGKDSLKKYFAANPLTDEKAKQLVFRVHVGFLVSCEGKAGNYFLVSKGKGDLATLAKQVLEIVNRMPQIWQAAIKDNKPIDSYQVLSFTVVEVFQAESQRACVDRPSAKKIVKRLGLRYPIR
jgi:hypothetical protein